MEKTKNKDALFFYLENNRQNLKKLKELALAMDIKEKNHSKLIITLGDTIEAMTEEKAFMFVAAFGIEIK